MNAMQFVFVPRGLTAAELERAFERCYRAFYTRPDVLWGMARLMAGEPRFIGRMASSAAVWMRAKLARAAAWKSGSPHPDPLPAGEGTW